MGWRCAEGWNGKAKHAARIRSSSSSWTPATARGSRTRNESCGAAKPRSPFWTSLTTETAFYAETLLPLIASHLNKSKAPLQIAAPWTVPRPATQIFVLVEKGAARQWVNPSTWSNPGCWRQYHQGNATTSVSKSGPLQAPGNDQKKAGACVIARSLIQAAFVGSEGGVEI